MYYFAKCGNLNVSLNQRKYQELYKEQQRKKDVEGLTEQNVETMKSVTPKLSDPHGKSSSNEEGGRTKITKTSEKKNHR